MNYSLWLPTLPVVQLVVRAVVVYAFILVALRVGGKRQIGQMGPAEFVALLLVSNAVQNSMNGGDNSITAGLILAGVLLALSAAIGWLSYRSRRFSDLIQGRSTLLVYKGEVVIKNLSTCRVSLHELRALLRRQGFHDLKDIHEAVLEANGSLSVVRRADLVESPRHEN